MEKTEVENTKWGEDLGGKRPWWKRLGLKIPNTFHQETNSISSLKANCSGVFNMYNNQSVKELCNLHRVRGTGGEGLEWFSLIGTTYNG